MSSNNKLAFVGDVHGNLHALQGLWDALSALRVPHVVFLGDYINKGADSAAVLAELVILSQTGRVTLLAGNHEIALIDALDRGDLGGFLKMGGAATIRSYIRGDVGPDVLAEFSKELPPSHLELLQGLSPSYETDDLIAQHLPVEGAGARFSFSAHAPVGHAPRIGRRSAQLDTGCGSGSGRLTAALWPSLEYVQVDADGDLITR